MGNQQSGSDSERNPFVDGSMMGSEPDTQKRSESSQSSSSSPPSSYASLRSKSTPRNTNLYLKLQKRELGATRGPYSLRSLPQPMFKKLSGEHDKVLDLLQNLDDALVKFDSRILRSSLISLSSKIAEAQQQVQAAQAEAAAATSSASADPFYHPFVDDEFHVKSGFHLGNGPSILQRILWFTDDSPSSSIPKSGKILFPSASVKTKVVNETLAILRELSYDNRSIAEELISCNDVLLHRLFALAASNTQESFDHAIGLLEELLLNRSDRFVFDLSQIPKLYDFISSLNTRQLAYFCRALSLCVHLPEEKLPTSSLMDTKSMVDAGLSHSLQELILPRQGTVADNMDRNNAILVNHPLFLKRLVQLISTQCTQGANDLSSLTSGIIAEQVNNNDMGGLMNLLMSMENQANSSRNSSRDAATNDFDALPDAWEVVNRQQNSSASASASSSASASASSISASSKSSKKNKNTIWYDDELDDGYGYYEQEDNDDDDDNDYEAIEEIQGDEEPRQHAAPSSSANTNASASEYDQQVVKIWTRKGGWVPYDPSHPPRLASSAVTSCSASPAAPSIDVSRHPFTIVSQATPVPGGGSMIAIPLDSIFAPPPPPTPTAAAAAPPPLAPAPAPAAGPNIFGIPLPNPADFFQGLMGGQQQHPQAPPPPQPQPQPQATAAPNMEQLMGAMANMFNGEDDGDDGANPMMGMLMQMLQQAGAAAGGGGGGGGVAMPVDGGSAASMSLQAIQIAGCMTEVFFVLITLLCSRRRVDVHHKLLSYGIVPLLNKLMNYLTWEEPPKQRAHPMHGPGCECDPQSAIRTRFLRLIQTLCDIDLSMSPVYKMLLLTPSELASVGAPPLSLFSSSSSSPAASIPFAAWQCADSEQGLLTKVITVLLASKQDSVYRYWLTCVVESFLRGSNPYSQAYCVNMGLLDYTVDNIASGAIYSMKGALQMEFDVLGELVKFNPLLFRALDRSLERENNDDDDDDQKPLSLFDRFWARLATCLVDSNVFIRAALLSYEYFVEHPELGYDPSSSKVLRKITQENRVELCRNLMTCVLSVGDICQENICCINTSLLFLIPPFAKGELPQALQAIQHYETHEMSVCDVSACHNFASLLKFHQKYYAHRAKETLSLEFSTRVPFALWRQLVETLSDGDSSKPTSLLHYRLAEGVKSLK